MEEYLEHPVPDNESSAEIVVETIPDISKQEDTSLEKAENGELDVKPNFFVPRDCLSAVSMPKNWSQVERLKQQRSILHKQLFAKKLNIKNDKNNSETVKGNIGSRNDNFKREKYHCNVQTLQKQRGLDCYLLCSNNIMFDDETDTCSSDDCTPRLHIAESCTSTANDDVHCMISPGSVSSYNLSENDKLVQTEKTNCKELVFCQDKKMENSHEESDENSSQKSLNSSDLCDLTASKINEALNNAIASVNVSKKQYRIKKVLDGLKMKAEEKETDNLEYRISKPLAKAGGPSNCSSGLSHASDNSLSLIENKSDPNLTLARNNANIAALNPTKYVGFSVNVDNVSKEFDYKNIALQKYLAEKRLKEQGANEVNMNSEDKIQENDKVVEKSVILNTSYSAESIAKASDNEFEPKPLKLMCNHGISKKKSQLKGEKELCQLKHELYQKRLKVKGPRSHDLKERILLAKQKMIEAKEKMLEAEIKLNRHKLKMVEKGMLLPAFPYLPCNFIGDSFTEEVTDSEEEVYKTDTKDNALVKDLPICMKESYMLVDQNRIKLQSQSSETYAKCKIEENEDTSDQLISSKTVMSQDGSVQRSSLEHVPVQQMLKLQLPSENIDSKKEVVSLQDNPKKQATETGNIKLNTDEKKILKKTKRKTKGIKKAGKDRTSVSKAIPVKTMAKTSEMPRLKMDSSINTSFSAKVEPAQNSVPSTIIQTCSVCNDFTRCSCYSKEKNGGQIAQNVVIPQANFLQTGAKNQHSVIYGGVQEPSPTLCQPNNTDKFILPSGFVKDEATNKIFHTYQFSGNTFAMIDNKLYQIHLKTTDGKTKKVIGALIPTAASSMSGSTRPKMTNAELSRQSSPASVLTATCSSSSVLRVTSASTLVTAAKLPNNPVSYKFPVNVIPSVGRTSQPLNLLIINTTSSYAATQSTQVIRKPLMNVAGGNNYVGAQLHKTFGQSARTTNSAIGNNPGLGASILQLPVASPHSDVFQSSSPVNASTIAVSSAPLIPLTVIQHASEKVLYISPKQSQQIYTTSQLAKSQVSPMAKSLLTKKTYMMMDSAPDVITKALNETRLSAGVATQKLEYCGSVLLSTALCQTTSENQMAKKPTSTMAKSVLIDKPVVKTRTESVSTDLGSDVSKSIEENLGNPTETNSDSLKTFKQTSTKSELEKTKDKASKKILDNDNLSCSCSKYRLPQNSPAKICSSMDSFIYTPKRKRKGTPFKKVSRQNFASSLQPQKAVCSQTSVLQNSPKDNCQNDPADQKYAAAEEKNNTNTAVHPDKICGPVPFLDYPARIVSSGKTGSCSKKVEIIASPKDMLKSGQSSDTSLDEEKMAKMISFANIIKEKTNKQQTVSEKLERRVFKKRRTDFRRISDESFSKKKDMDSETDIKPEKSVAIVEKEQLLDIKLEMAISTCLEEGKRSENEPAIALLQYCEKNLQKPDLAANEDLKHKERDRNMFDEFEQQLVSRQNSLTDSCNELNDSYDSSDVEIYEKIVSSQRHASAVMKPKSQFIESYYTSQGMKEKKRFNIEQKVSYPIAGSYNTSESCQNISELETVNLPKKLNLNNSKAFCLGSEKRSEIPEIKQDQSVVSLKSSVEADNGPCNKWEVAQDAGKKVSQKPFVSVGGRQVKRFIKSKFIILKGDICDRWFEIKKKTGFGEMSDPKFIHYLLRLEEERQTRMAHIKEAQTKKGNIYNIGDFSAATEEVLQEKPDHGSRVVDINNNNNANSFTDERECYSDDADMEDTIVNVTDTPGNSPRLSEVSTSDIEFQVCSETNNLLDTSASIASCQEKLGDKTENPSDEMIKATEKVLPKDHIRKRPAAKIEDFDIPAAKKQFSILSDATQRQMRWAVSLFRGTNSWFTFMIENTGKPLEFVYDRFKKKQDK